MYPTLRTCVLGVILMTLTACSSEHTDSVETNDDINQQSSSDTKTFHIVDSFNVGNGGYVRSLAEEPSSNSLWVGTSAGVLQVDLKTHNPVKTFTRDDGLANEYVFSIFIDSLGNKWFGTNGGGVSRYNEGKWKTFFPMHGLADYWIYNFAEQADGTLWIGTWAGANKYDPATEKFTTYVKELINEWVYGLGIDSKQQIWFGTEGGVSLFDGSKWSEWNHDDGLGAANTDELPASTNTGLGTRSRHDLSTMQLGSATYNPNYVFSILVDRNDHIWAGTWGGGASKYDGTQWTNISTADGLAGNIVYSIAEEKGGALWFGTNKGACRYAESKWQCLDKNHGLLGNNVYAIQITSAGDVWLGTENGVARASKK